MRAGLKVAWLAVLGGFCAQAVCAPNLSVSHRGPVLLSSALRVAVCPPMLDVLMWRKFWAVRPGMTPAQVMQAGPFIQIRPLRPQRPGWCTVAYFGPLTPDERKALGGKLMEIDVQIVMRPGPVSVFNPPTGSLNPTMTGETIAAVSAPYAGDGGGLCID